MTKEEIAAFKPIINSMKLLRSYCDAHDTCDGCLFDRPHCCMFEVPERWECESAIAILEEQEDNDGRLGGTE